MKLERRIIAVGVAALLTLGAIPDGFCAPAKKAYSQKKSSGSKTSSQKGKSARSRKSGGKTYLSGTNVYGRTGLMFTDTAEIAEERRMTATGGLVVSSGDSLDQTQFPIGVNYGLKRNLEVYGGWEFLSRKMDAPAGTTGSSASQSGLGTLTLGGKYLLLEGTASRPAVAAAADLLYGPFSDKLGEKGMDFNIKAMASQTIAGRLFVNAGLGILMIGSREVEVVNPFTGGTTTAKTKSDSVVQVNGGLGAPISPTLTYIAEVAMNQFGDKNGILATGIRGDKKKYRYHLTGGFGIGNAAADFTLGGGIEYPFR